jgi:hypothetical protein
LELAKSRQNYAFIPALCLHFPAISRRICLFLRGCCCLALRFAFGFRDVSTARHSPKPHDEKHAGNEAGGACEARRSARHFDCAAVARSQSKSRRESVAGKRAFREAAAASAQPAW